MGIFSKIWGEPEYEGDDDLGLEESMPRSKRNSDTAEEVAVDAPRKGNKVVNIHATAQLQVVLVKPERFDQVTEIADRLRDKQSVVLNLESTNKDVARRLVDFLSGCSYALDGSVRKVAQSTYLFCPYNMDIVGDLENLQSEVESYI